MKIRIGFVSNSSSSSFVCDHCSRVESGWDMGLSDAEMVVCSNGHMLCQEHLYDNYTEARDYIADLIQNKISEKINRQDAAHVEYEASSEWAQEARQALEELRSLENPDIGSMGNVLSGYFDIYDLMENFPACCCPICQLDDLPDYYLLRWMLHKYRTTKPDVLQEIKSQFHNLQEMMDTIR